MGHQWKRKQSRAKASSTEDERDSSSKGEVSNARRRAGKEAEDIDVAEEDILEELAFDDLARMEGPDA